MFFVILDARDRNLVVEKQQTTIFPIV